MAGFWPSEWIEGATPRNPKGVPDSVARALGLAIISTRPEVEVDKTSTQLFDRQHA